MQQHQLTQENLNQIKQKNATSPHKDKGKYVENT